MVKRNTEFPKVKGLYKKRTAAGVRYVLRGTKKDGGHLIRILMIRLTVRHEIRHQKRELWIERI